MEFGCLDALRGRAFFYERVDGENMLLRAYLGQDEDDFHIDLGRLGLNKTRVLNTVHPHDFVYGDLDSISKKVEDVIFPRERIMGLFGRSCDFIGVREQSIGSVVESYINRFQSKQRIYRRGEFDYNSGSLTGARQ